MASCIDIQDLLDFKINGCAVSENLCATSVDLTSALCEITDYIEHITCTKWCPEESCKTFDGTGDCVLFFSPDTSGNLISITSIKELSCSSSCPSTTVTILPCNLGTHLNYTCGDSFPCGNKNIEVCGMWGTPIPFGIKRAIILLTLERVQSGITGVSKTDRSISSVSWEDFSLSFDQSSIATDFFISTGFLDIDQLIFPYIPTNSQISIATIDNDCNKCCKNKKGNCKCT